MKCQAIRRDLREVDGPIGEQARWPTLRRDGPTPWFLNLTERQRGELSPPADTCRLHFRAAGFSALWLQCSACRRRNYSLKSLKCWKHVLTTWCSIESVYCDFCCLFGFCGSWPERWCLIVECVHSNVTVIAVVQLFLVRFASACLKVLLENVQTMHPEILHKNVILLPLDGGREFEKNVQDFLPPAIRKGPSGKRAHWLNGHSELIQQQRWLFQALPDGHMTDIIILPPGQCYSEVVL